MLRQVEEWENKYIKLIFNKRFRIFKWEIMIAINIDNIDLYKEWAKRSEQMLKEITTKTSSNKTTWTPYKNGRFK